MCKALMIQILGRIGIRPRSCIRPDAGRRDSLPFLTEG